MTAGNPRLTAEEILGVIQAHASEQAMTWLRAALPTDQRPFARGPFFGAYAGAGRRFGHQAPSLLAADHKRLRAAGVTTPEASSLADYVRGALLLSACAATPQSEHVAIATEAFRKGDNAERVALLRVLSLLPAPERFVDLALEAARTHVQDVFEALCCDNAFASRHFEEASWNQLVMKALFTGAPVARMVGWRDRLNPELQRMADDFEAERKAASRPIPEDIGLMREAAKALQAAPHTDNSKD